MPNGQSLKARRKEARVDVGAGGSAWIWDLEFDRGGVGEEVGAGWAGLIRG